MKHPLGQTRNGIPIQVDLITSRAAKYIAQQPYILRLAKEALSKRTLREPSIVVEYDMGRVIGYEPVMVTSENDTIFYAQLLRDTIYTRFVKNGKPLATQYLTLVLNRGRDDISYDLEDVWIGQITPPRPGSDAENLESKSYWENHAYIFNDQPLQARTVTKICPY